MNDDGQPTVSYVGQPDFAIASRWTDYPVRNMAWLTVVFIRVNRFIWARLPFTFRGQPVVLSSTRRLDRFLENAAIPCAGLVWAVAKRGWGIWPGQEIRLIVDGSKVGFGQSIVNGGPGLRGGPFLWPGRGSTVGGVIVLAWFNWPCCSMSKACCPPKPGWCWWVTPNLGQYRYSNNSTSGLEVCCAPKKAVIWSNSRAKTIGKPLAVSLTRLVRVTGSRQLVWPNNTLSCQPLGLLGHRWKGTVVISHQFTFFPRDPTDYHAVWELKKCLVT